MSKLLFKCMSNVLFKCMSTYCENVCRTDCLNVCRTYCLNTGGPMGGPGVWGSRTWGPYGRPRGMGPHYGGPRGMDLKYLGLKDPGPRGRWASRTRASRTQGPMGRPMGAPWGKVFLGFNKLSYIYIEREQYNTFTGQIWDSYSSYEDDIKTSRSSIPFSTIWQGQTIKISCLREVYKQITFSKNVQTQNYIF